MEEKIQNEEIREKLNATVEHILRLPIEVVFPRTTVMGRLWKAMKRLGKKPDQQHSKCLLDIAVSNLRVLSTLVRTAKSNTTHQQGLSATGCDLLKIRYLCGRNDNARPSPSSSGGVVICSKFAIFAVEMTTPKELLSYSHML